jgi:hypothetical protein
MKRLSIVFILLLASMPADAVVRIPVSRETMHVGAILSVMGFLGASAFCFYKKERRLGIMFLALVVFPLATTGLFALAGVPIRWW